MSKDRLLRSSLRCKVSNIVLKIKALIDTAFGLMLVCNAVLFVEVVTIGKVKIFARHICNDNKITACKGVALNVLIKGHTSVSAYIQLYMRVESFEFCLQFNNTDILHDSTSWHSPHKID